MVGEECIITTKAENAAFDFGKDADIVSSDMTTGKHIVRYLAPGIKTIRMLTDGGSAKSIDIYPAGIRMKTMTLDDKAFSNISGVVDLDEDGCAELWGTTGLFNQETTNFFSATSDVTKYTRIKKLWNSNLPRVNFAPIDFNRDGHVDLLNWENGKAYTITNEEDMDATFSSFDTPRLEILKMADTDHDGLPDFFCDADKGVGLKFVEGNTLFSRESYPGGRKIFLYDFNNDGFIDFTLIGDKLWTIYLNQGLERPGFFKENAIVDLSRKELRAVCDFDNDGEADFLCAQSNYFIPFVQWSDGSRTELSDIQAVAGGPYIADINNDGLFDIYFQGRLINCSQSSAWNSIVAYQLPGRKFECHYVNEITSDNATDIMFKDAEGEMRNILGTFVAKNEKPEAPSGLRASQNSNGVVIEWNPAVDKESHSRQMSYNISVKHKGKNGENSYLISPMNDGKNNVPVPQPYVYTKGTSYQIPIYAISPGDYEIKVQALDAWMETSDFSETLDFTVNPNIAFELNPSSWVDTSTEIKLLTNTSTDIDLDGGLELERRGNSIFAVWDKTGLKTVNIGGVSQKILIIEKPKGDFIIPEGIGIDETRILQCTNAKDGYWTVSVNGGSENINGFFCDLEVIDGNVAFTPYALSFTYTISHIVSDAIGEVTYSHEVNPIAKSAPILNPVSIDDATGKYILSANPSNDHQTGYNVYRETDKANEFALIAESIPFAQSYIDTTSNPRTASVRYMIKAIYADGGESCQSTVHQPVHLMINKSAVKGWNLMWTQYEGIDIESYSILRGTSPTGMQPVHTVSGNSASWVDATAPEGTLFYAVEPLVASPAGKFITRAETTSSRSNVVSTSEAREVEAINNIAVRIIEGPEILQDKLTIRFGAYVSPANATIKTVHWTIEHGDDLATIDQSGLLTPKTNHSGGTVVVRATALDGSGIYGEYSIRGGSGLNEEISNLNKPLFIDCHPTPALDFITVSLPEIDTAEIYVVNLNGVIYHSETTTEKTLKINVSSYPEGHYIIMAVYPDGTRAKGRFIKR